MTEGPGPSQSQSQAPIGPGPHRPRPAVGFPFMSQMHVGYKKDAHVIPSLPRIRLAEGPLDFGASSMTDGGKEENRAERFLFRAQEYIESRHRKEKEMLQLVKELAIQFPESAGDLRAAAAMLDGSSDVLLNDFLCTVRPTNISRETGISYDFEPATRLFQEDECFWHDPRIDMVFRLDKKRLLLTTEGKLDSSPTIPGGRKRGRKESPADDVSQSHDSFASTERRACRLFHGKRKRGRTEERSWYCRQQCDVCGSRMFLLDDHEACRVCRMCGTIQVQVGSGTSFPTGTGTTIGASSFKHLSHFQRLLAQVQAKQKHAPPEEVIDLVRTQMRKYKIGPEDLTPHWIRLLLFMNRPSKNPKFQPPTTEHYANIPWIFAHITGKMPPQISDREEEMLRILFRQCLLPFSTTRPANRHNLPPYTYLLGKFYEALGFPAEYRAVLREVKSTECNRELDRMWKPIAEQVGLPYIPTV